MWFFIFLQDMVDTVKPIIEPMMSSFKQKDCFSLDVLALAKHPSHAHVH